MAVGLAAPGRLRPVKGIELATTAAGIRHAGREDMVLMTIAENASTAAVFTRNKFCAAPVILARQNLLAATPRALLINAGNANAGTGEQGLRNAQLSCQLVADKLAVNANQVLPFSTGVIGEQLPMPAVRRGIESLQGKTRQDNWLAAARAIMTTDTMPKAVSAQVQLGDHKVTLTGIVKGAGMICPNMATLLCFVATDAAIEASTLQLMLQQANQASFNRITVDSDTSTNDALVLSATGASGMPEIRSMQDQNARVFYDALQEVLTGLATAVIRDAEGATKFVKIEVVGGQSEEDCAEIAYSIAHSPLVKTALFASDPNWGRLLMAIGKARVAELAVQRINISVNEVSLIENGQPAAGYTEQAGQLAFQQEEIVIRVDLSLGIDSYHVWTSDLSHDYVSINADYRS